jgi:hypothetical protein
MSIPMYQATPVGDRYRGEVSLADGTLIAQTEETFDYPWQATRAAVELWESLRDQGKTS